MENSSWPSATGAGRCILYLSLFLLAVANDCTLSTILRTYLNKLLLLLLLLPLLINIEAFTC